MRPGRRTGSLLVEVLIASVLGAMVVGTLCEMYLAGQRSIKRIQAEATAWRMANLGMERMAVIAEQGVSFEAKDGGTTLKVVLPRLVDSAGHYVPKADATGLKYENGEEVNFYLANSTGTNSGDILWIRRKPVGGSDTPDPEWSLTPGTTLGRVQPISSLTVVKVNNFAVTVTITATQPYSGKNATVSLTRTIYMRHNNG
jgi:Tfp pilus assembly protein PilW